MFCRCLSYLEQQLEEFERVEHERMEERKLQTKKILGRGMDRQTKRDINSQNCRITAVKLVTENKRPALMRPEKIASLYKTLFFLIRFRDRSLLIPALESEKLS